MNKNTKSVISLIIKLILITAVAVSVILNYDKLINIDVRAIAEQSASPFLAWASVIGIYALKGAVFVIPASLIYISVGMAFQPMQAILINLIGISAEITVSYIFGVLVGGEYVKKLLKKSKGGNKLLTLKEKNKFLSVLAIRFIPVFPIDFSGLFFGSAKMNFFSYFISSLLGIAPRVILFTLLGDKAYDYIPMKLIIALIICCIPICAAVITVKWVREKRSEKTQ